MPHTATIPAGPTPVLTTEGCDAQRFQLKRDSVQYPAVIAWADRSIFAELERWRASWLSPYELAGYNNCGIEKRRMDYLLGRLAAKLAIYTLLQEPESALAATDDELPVLSKLRSIEIAMGAFTQPLARAPQAGDISPAVCYTHSDGVAVAIAFPDGHPLGVDLEIVTERRLKVLKTQISEGELTDVFIPKNGHHVPTELDAYTQGWCAKESLSKVLRCGLTVPFEVLALKNTHLLPSSTVPMMGGEFKNFTQYRFESFSAGRFAVSIVLPRRTSAAWPVEWLSERLESSVPVDPATLSTTIARSAAPAPDTDTAALT
ncbi:hypothetical protein DB346_19695 [Verrucomicrobia bacterium LW23]|nr:hypothetical protein DB346_19695 [Verrucomicrobia bacterium LW23]